MCNNLRIGWLEYINALPLNLPFQLGEIEWQAYSLYALPSVLNQLLRKRQLDIALTSSVEYLEGHYEMLPGYGIAGDKRILSVNFYTQLPLASLNGKRVGLTHHSATAAALLKILCHHLWRIEPLFEPLQREQPFSNYAAFLLIGDEALTHPSFPKFQTIDLAAAWHALTALPFVFALFACQPDIDPETKTACAQKIEAALRWSETHRPLVESEALKKCSLSAPCLRHYFDLLHYRLGKKEMEGLECFKKLQLNVPPVST